MHTNNMYTISNFTNSLTRLGLHNQYLPKCPRFIYRSQRSSVGGWCGRVPMGFLVSIVSEWDSVNYLTTTALTMMPIIGTAWVQRTQLTISETKKSHIFSINHSWTDSRPEIVIAALIYRQIKREKDREVSERDRLCICGILQEILDFLLNGKIMLTLLQLGLTATSQLKLYNQILTYNTY